jgi:hypothetical protein
VKVDDAITDIGPMDAIRAPQPSAANVLTGC